MVIDSAINGVDTLGGPRSVAAHARQILRGGRCGAGEIRFPEKLAALFSVGNSAHQARFNKLITPEVMEENHIVKTCGRPVTWQYQG